MMTIYTDGLGKQYILSKKGKRCYEKLCQHCFELYFPRKSNQIYCSSSCRVRACWERNDYVNQQPAKKQTGKSIRSKASELESVRPQDIELTQQPVKEQALKATPKQQKTFIEGTLETVAGNAIYDIAKSILTPSPSQVESRKPQGKAKPNPTLSKNLPSQKPLILAQLTTTGKTIFVQSQSGKNVKLIEKRAENGQLYYMDLGKTIYRIERGKLIKVQDITSNK